MSEAKKIEAAEAEVLQQRQVKVEAANSYKLATALRDVLDGVPYSRAKAEELLADLGYKWS